MADNANIDVKMTAQFADLLAGMEKSAHSVKSATDKMKGDFKGLTETVEIVEKAFVALAGILAGGKIFREAIDVVTQGVEKSRLFAQELGASADEAAGLTDALDMIGASTETYLGSIERLSRQVRTNEAGLNSMGLATRDASGHLKESAALFYDAIAVLGSYKAGTDRNTVAGVLFGRSIRDVQGLMRLTKESVDEGTESMRALGLVTGTEDVAANYRFMKVQNETRDVFEAMGKVLGQALLPILSQLGEWFAQIGPAAVETLRLALYLLLGPIYALIGGFRFLYDAGVLVFGALGQAISRTSEAFAQAAHGDFAGAWKTIVDGSNDADVGVAGAFEKMKANAAKTASELDRLFNPTTTSAPAETGGKAAPDFKPQTVGEQFDILKSKMEQWKEEQPSLLADISAQESAYWRDALTRAGGSAELMRKIKHEIYTLDVSEAKRSLSAELATLKEQELAAKDHYALRVQYAVTAAEKIGTAYRTESPEYKKALAEINAMAMAERDRQIKLAQDEIDAHTKHAASLLSIEEAHVNAMAAIHQLTDAEQITAIAAFHEKSYQIEAAALKQKLGMLDEWSTAYANTISEISKLEDGRNVQAAKSNDDLLQSSAKTIEGYLTPITAAIEQSTLGVAQGTITMRKAVQGILQSIEAQFVSMIAKRVVRWAAGELALTTATAVGTGARAGIEHTAGTVSLALQAGRIIKKILAYAAETFGGVFAFLSGSMGPYAAGPAAVSSAAVAAGIAGVNLSAAGGYDIPAGLNPTVQTHAREMILPASIADPLRNMLAGGGSSGGGVTVNVHAIDAKGVSDLFHSHGGVLVDALRKQMRGFQTA